MDVINWITDVICPYFGEIYTDFMHVNSYRLHIGIKNHAQTFLHADREANEAPIFDIYSLNIIKFLQIAAAHSLLELGREDWDV